MFWELGVSVKDVNAMTLGGHGDDMVPLIRYASVQGIPVMELLEKKYKSKKRPRKSWTPWSSAPAVRAAKWSPCSRPAAPSTARPPRPSPWPNRFLKDQKRVLPTCVYLNGEFGVKGYYVGVPVRPRRQRCRAHHRIQA
jgi:malate dehydrogenase